VLKHERERLRAGEFARALDEPVHAAAGERAAAGLACTLMHYYA